MKTIVALLLALALAAPSLFAQVGQSPGVVAPQNPTLSGTIDATGGVFTGASPICMEGATANAFETCFTVTDPTVDRNLNLPDASGTVFLTPALDPHTYYVDSAHYPTVLAALTAINADAALHGSYLDTNYVVKIAPGTYADNLVFTNEKHIRLEGTGVELSGTLTFTQSQQGGDYYSRVEFVGMEGFRAEKGPAFKISGNMSGTRNNDSLTYFTFKGVWITGNFSWDGDGTPVVQFFGCRMNGTIDTVTLASADAGILLEADWTEFASGSITDKVSLYNVRNSDFYGAINTTPWYGSTFFNTGFHSTVSIVPQVGAAETTIKVDGNSHASLLATSPTTTGATVTNLDQTFTAGTNSITTVADPSDPSLTTTTTDGTDESTTTQDPTRISQEVVNGTDTAEVFLENGTVISASVSDGATNGSINVGATGPWDATSGAKPACDATTRSRRWYVEGGAGVADTYEVCMKDGANAYAWKVLATP
jgi:hypothetical protein